MAILLLTACGGSSTVEEQASPRPRDVLPMEEGNLMRLGNATRAAGDLKAAEKLYLDAIKQANGSQEPYLALAALYQANNEPLKAIDTLKDGAAVQRDDPRIAITLANMLIANGRSLEALKYTKMALEIAPDNPRAYNTQGVALDNAGRYDDAQESYAKALKLEGKDKGYIQNNLALSYIMSDDYKDAIDLLKPIAESKGSTPTIRQNLALAYGLKGDEKTAKEWMMKDLSEEKANQNIAFYKQYSKERVLSSREISTETSSDTAVESVAVNDLDMPQSLLDTPAKPVPAAQAEAKPTMKPGIDPAEFAAMTPVFKPSHIAQSDVSEAAPKEVAAKEEIAVKEIASKPVSPKEQAEALVQEKAREIAAEAAAPKAFGTARFKPERSFETAEASEVSMMKPIMKPLADMEPAAGVEKSEAAPVASSSFTTLPRPHFKPRLD